MKLWRSGIFWSALGIVSGVGNFLCSSIIAHHLAPYPGEFKAGNTALDFTNFLGLPLQMLYMSVIHYIAHFRGKNDQAQLQGLLAGCQKLLFRATIAGSLLALFLWEPLGRFFQFPRTTLMLAALICGLVSWWSGFGMAMCQGMAWFKRIAIIGVIGVSFRLVFAWLVTKPFPTAEFALSSTTVALLANFILFYWWKDIFRHPAQTISPWTKEFMQFLLVTGATVAGNWFFTQGDGLVSQKYFSATDGDAYQTAARFGRAISWVVLPLLNVVFTSRSGSKEAAAKTDQSILLTLYAAGLAGSALGLIILRKFLVSKFLGAGASPTLHDEAARMIVPFSIAMVMIGLTQAVGMWSLADRSFKIALLYGALGLANWVTLLLFGRTPDKVLTIMPIFAGVSFCILSVCWFVGHGRKTAEAIT